ncbi:Growth-regulating factor [Zea mays]|uniref:Growth-regulating factor n=1 Tax=Zea mays TaxID=4577 RepID=A0A1D6JDJ2_MAIZE|nr:Growth-regulating factor [Zea mays]
MNEYRACGSQRLRVDDSSVLASSYHAPKFSNDICLM